MALADTAPTGISIASRITLNFKDCLKLSYVIYPSGAESSVTWTTSDKNVAVVDASGCVFAVKPGSCTITATTSNGKQAQCKVSVLDHDASLIVWHKNGERVRYKLNTYPRIKQSNGRLWIISDQMEISYPQSSVKMFTLEEFPNDDITAINDNQDREPDADVSVSFATPGSTVFIFDSNGRQLQTILADSDGRLQYSLDAFPPGIYIIKSDSATIKITKK